MSIATTFSLISPAFGADEKIPLRYTGEGEDVSPPLEWDNAPAGTAEWALICDDPDAPTPQPWVHWVLYGLAGATRALPENMPRSAESGAPPTCRQGANSWSKPGYNGPLPPKGHGVHHYHFTLYALGKALGAAPGLDKEALLAAIKDAGALLGTTTLTGLYERK